MNTYIKTGGWLPANGINAYAHLSRKSIRMRTYAKPGRVRHSFTVSVSCAVAFLFGRSSIYLQTLWLRSW